MLVWKKINWLRERVAEQKKWIESCGGDLTGYIARYGDPGVPPLDKNGKPKTVCIPAELADDLSRTEDMPPDTYYAPHFGDGGTAIYEADFNRLKLWEQELSEICVTSPAARQKADEFCIRKPQQDELSDTRAAALARIKALDDAKRMENA